MEIWKRDLKETFYYYSMNNFIRLVLNIIFKFGIHEKITHHPSRSQLFLETIHSW